jgi:hypothetical protein
MLHLPRALRMADDSTVTAAQGASVGRAFVRLWIAVAVLIFLGAIALIAYRWLVTEEPSSVLILDGSPALRGAEAQVQRPDQLEPFKSVFGDPVGFSLPFYLDPGTYQVRVMMNGEQIFQTEVTLPIRYLQRLDLTKLEPPAASSRAPTPTTVGG